MTLDDLDEGANCIVFDETSCVCPQDVEDGDREYGRSSLRPVTMGRGRGLRFSFPDRRHRMVPFGFSFFFQALGCVLEDSSNDHPRCCGFLLGACEAAVDREASFHKAQAALM